FRQAKFQTVRGTLWLRTTERRAQPIVALPHIPGFEALGGFRHTGASASPGFYVHGFSLGSAPPPDVAVESMGFRHETFRPTLHDVVDHDVNRL
ncbi:MAG: hypothetical protein HYZ89_04320, partial [Candidatus Omnitrophica bacterium]|nr:hypothetical protein [Candidatus Omnitrophota bacterium]